MKSHNFIIAVTDTDSTSICKQDMSSFTEEEQQALLDEINALMPPLIQYTHDGYFLRCVALKAKNYILYDGKSLKIKGSALKASTKSPALKKLIKDAINILVFEQDTESIHNQMRLLYTSAIKEAATISSAEDIRKWSARKTITEKVLKNDRTTETKVRDALEGSSYVEGDRVHMFFLPDDSLSLVENFSGEYNKTRLYGNIYDTLAIFSTVLPTKELFIKYTLKKNMYLPEEL